MRSVAKTSGRSLLATLALMAMACSTLPPYNGAGSTGSTGAATSGSTSAGSSGKGSATGAVGSTGSSGTGGNASTGSGSGNGGGSTGGTSSGGTTGGPPCLLDAGSPCQPTNGIPPGCWFSPQTSDQIMNACTLAPYDQSIPLPPPAGPEHLPLYDGGGFPVPSP